MVSVENLTKLATALGGLPVLGCRPGSPAALAGIRYGDIVLAVNDAPTPDWGRYVEARAASRTHMSTVVFRDGEELRLEFELDTSPPDPMSWLAYLSSDGGAGGDDDV